MGTTTNEQGLEPRSIPVDPDLFDEIQFRPINKGLGFHHDAKKASVPVYSSASRIKRPLERTERPMHAARPGTASEGAGPSPSYYARQDSLPSIPKAELGHMYKGVAELPSIPSASPLPPSSIQAQENVPAHRGGKPAARWKQLLAWALDTAIIVLTQAAVLTGLFAAAGLNWPRVIETLGPQDTLLMNGLLFCFTYLLYFTVLDLGASPGKGPLRIRVVRADGGRAGAWNTAIRAFITLLSLPLLGLPLLMDFQGKLSETSLVEE